MIPAPAAAVKNTKSVAWEKINELRLQRLLPICGLDKAGSTVVLCRKQLANVIQKNTIFVTSILPAQKGLPAGFF